MNDNGQSKNQDSKSESGRKKPFFKDADATVVFRVSDENAPKAELDPEPKAGIVPTPPAVQEEKGLQEVLVLSGAQALPEADLHKAAGDLARRTYDSFEGTDTKSSTKNWPEPPVSSPDKAKSKEKPWAPGAWLCWTFIAITSLWVVVPDAYTWFDPKPDLHKHQAKAVQAFFQGNKEVLRGECNQYLLLEPEAAGAYFGRGYASLMANGNTIFSIPTVTQDALSDLTKACSLAPQDYVFNAFLGLTLSQNGKITEAIPVLEKALKLNHSLIVPWPVESAIKDVTDHTVQRQLGNSLLLSGKYDEAIQHYKLCRLSPSYMRSDYGYEMLAEEYAHEPSRALLNGMEWSDYYRDPSETFYSLKLHNFVLKRSLLPFREDKTIVPAMNLFYEALCLHGLKKYEQAIDRLNQAIALRSDYGDFYLVRAACYRNLNQKQRALTDLDKALQDDPSNAFALNFKKQLGKKDYKEILREPGVFGYFGN